MNKGLKIVGIVAAVLVLVVVVLVVLVQIFVTPERIKAVLIPRAQEALQREITLGDIEVGLIRGITLNNLTILEKDGTEPFIAADRVVLRFKIIPLLFRRVIVDEVRLDRPLIRVERLTEDRFNFSDLLDERAAEVVPSEERDETPVDLLISQIAVQGGELLFIDHAHGGDSPLQYRLSAFDFSARSISLTDPFPWQAQGNLNGGRLAASGRIDPGAGEGEMNLEVSALDAALFAPYFQDALPGRLNAMEISLNVSARGNAQRVSSSGEIWLEGIDLLLEREGEAPLPLRGASLGITYGLAADLEAEAVALEESTLRFNGIPATIAGRVENYATEPRVNLRLTVPELELRSTLAALPQGILPPVAEFDPAGRVSAWIDLSGPVAQVERLLQQGEITLNQVSANLGETRAALGGLLRLGPGTLTSENLVLQMGENRAAIDLQVKNLFGEIIQVTSNVQADRFALDPLLGTAAAAAEPAPGVKPEGPAPQPEPLDLPLRAEGTVRIGQTVYKGLAMDDFLLQYLLEKNVLTVKQITGKVVGGSFQGNARVDLGNRQPPFSAALELQGMQADPMVSAFLPGAAGTVFGTLNLQTQLEGRGTEAAQIRKSLTGKGSVSILDGQLTGEGLVRDLATFLNLEELRVLRFNQAKGSFTVRDGNLLLDSVIDGRDVRLNPKGTVGLENFALDLALDPRFSPELTRKLDTRGTVTQFLKDEQGWGRVPIRVAGTAAQPRFTIDTTGIQRQLKERAGEELRQQLERGVERLLPRQAPPAQEPAPGEEPKRSPLEDALKGLFR